MQDVTVQEVIDHFGSPIKMAEKIGMSVKSVYLWRNWGYISGPGCDRVEKETNGKFKAIELRELVKSARGRGLYERLHKKNSKQ